MSDQKTPWKVRGGSRGILLTLLFVVLVVQAFPQVVLLFAACRDHNSPLELHNHSISAPAAVAGLCLSCSDLPRQIGYLSLSFSSDLVLEIRLVPNAPLRL
jgi:hypothetical protein